MDGKYRSIGELETTLELFDARFMEIEWSVPGYYFDIEREDAVPGEIFYTVVATPFGGTMIMSDADGADIVAVMAAWNHRPDYIKVGLSPRSTSIYAIQFVNRFQAFIRDRWHVEMETVTEDI